MGSRYGYLDVNRIFKEYCDWSKWMFNGKYAESLNWEEVKVSVSKWIA